MASPPDARARSLRRHERCPRLFAPGRFSLERHGHIYYAHGQTSLVSPPGAFEALHGCTERTGGAGPGRPSWFLGSRLRRPLPGFECSADEHPDHAVDRPVFALRPRRQLPRDRCGYSDRQHPFSGLDSSANRHEILRGEKKEAQTMAAPASVSAVSGPLCSGPIVFGCTIRPACILPPSLKGQASRPLRQRCARWSLLTSASPDPLACSGPRTLAAQFLYFACGSPTACSGLRTLATTSGRSDRNP